MMTTTRMDKWWYISTMDEKEQTQILPFTFHIRIIQCISVYKLLGFSEFGSNQAFFPQQISPLVCLIHLIRRAVCYLMFL